MRDKFLIVISIIVGLFIVVCSVVIALVQFPDLRTMLFSDKNKESIVTTINNQAQTQASNDQISTSSIVIPYDAYKEKLTTEMKTYVGYKDHVSIEYPVLKGLEDKELLDKINQKIYINALSIVKLYPISTKLQTLTINAKVDQLNEKRIVIIYQGRVVGTTVVADDYNGGIGNTTGSGVVARGVHSDNPSNNYQVNDPNAIGNMQAIAAATANVEAARKAMEAMGISINAPNSGTSGLPIRGFTGTEDEEFSNKDVFGFSRSIAVDQRIFYTSTIDLETAKDVNLASFAKPEVLAKYARSSKVEIVNIEEDQRANVRNYINKNTVAALTDVLKKADFRNLDLTSWPKSFSYEKDGYIYFTIRLSSKLGNYALCRYKLDN